MSGVSQRRATIRAKEYHATESGGISSIWIDDMYEQLKRC